MPEPVDIASTQRLLLLDEALVSYFVLRDRILAWFVPPNGEPAYRDIPIDSADLAKMVGRVRASLAANKPFDALIQTAISSCVIEPPSP